MLIEQGMDGVINDAGNKTMKFVRNESYESCKLFRHSYKHVYGIGSCI